MDPRKKNRTESSLMLMVAFSLVVLAAAFHGAAAAAASQPSGGRKSTRSMAANRLGSSFVLPVTGNVYPLGYYAVSLNIGNPTKVFDFDIDTGSDLTWVQCDAPCTGCTVPRARQYRPNNNAMACSNSLCTTVPGPEDRCKDPKDQCDYEIHYVDHSSTLGVVVTDEFHVKLTNGTVLHPRLAFGCGYDQMYPGPNAPPPTAGVIGLGKGKASILSQLSAQGLTRNVIGHCLSPIGGGFMFIGDDLAPNQGIVWTPMSPNLMNKNYIAGPADLLFNGQTTHLKGLDIIFDSGSSYTYFGGQAYKLTLNLIKGGLHGKPLRDAPQEKALSVCWKGTKPFKSISDVRDNFKTLALSFGRNIQLQLPPEGYLIITKAGNVCLGILDGTEIGLKDANLIGDISLQDIMVIYDNEKQQIGWAPVKCDRLPNVDRGCSEAFWHFGMAEEQCPANYASV